MARGTTLGELVRQLRAEIRHSTSSAVGVDELEGLKNLLQRTQAYLYQEYFWDFLRVREGKVLNAGQRYYDFPTRTNLDRIIRVTTKWGGNWKGVTRGISDEQFNEVDSDADSRLDPVMRWDILDTGSAVQFEVWPVPATAGTIRFVSMRPLNALIANADKADLDDRLIVLHAAAEMRQGQKDGKAKADLAASYLFKLRRNASSGGSFKIGGGAQDVPVKREIVVRIAGA